MGNFFSISLGKDRSRLHAKSSDSKMSRDSYESVRRDTTRFGQAQHNMQAHGDAHPTLRQKLALKPLRELQVQVVFGAVATGV